MSRPSGPPGGYGVDLPTGVLPTAADPGQRTDPLAVVSLSIGSVTLVVGFCCFPFSGIALGLTGVIVGIVSLTRIASGQARTKGKGLAIAGIVLSVLAPVVNAALMYLIMR